MIIYKKIKKDIFLRKFFAKKESFNKILKIFLRIRLIKYSQILNIYFCFRKNYSYPKIKNRCFITSRSCSTYKRLTLSRMKVKEFINNNLILGAKKYTW